jgi:hypothetical protein
MDVADVCCSFFLKYDIFHRGMIVSNGGIDERMVLEDLMLLWGKEGEAVGNFEVIACLEV